MRTARDIIILFCTRIVRLFAYGAVSVILVLYLSRLGLGEGEIGLLLSGTLAGDAVISLWMTTSADRIGRRRMLRLGAGLMIFAGLVFMMTKNPVFLLIAAVIGVISPSGHEIGPFLAIEQAALTHMVSNEQRTRLLSWYSLAGSSATAVGALSGGLLVHVFQANGVSPLESDRVILGVYVVCGLILYGAFHLVSPAIEVAAPIPGTSRVLGLHKSRNLVFRLSALFALDAFAGGFIVQSIIAYWFHVKFGVAEAAIGGILFGANLLAGLSSVLAARLAKKIGLVNTMVFTHLPSSVLLCVVPLMPTLSLAIVVLLLRYCISQMDVPTRQSYTLAVVSSDERSAASGVTNIARSIGASVSPSLSGLLLATPALLSAPFFFAGGLKILYDLLLYRSFRMMKPPEESAGPANR